MRKLKTSNLSKDSTVALYRGDHKFSYRDSVKICAFVAATCFFSSYIHAEGIEIVEKIGNDLIHTAKSVGLIALQFLIGGAAGYKSYTTGGSFTPIIAGAGSAGGLGILCDQF